MAGWPNRYRRRIKEVDALTREVNVRQQPLYLEWLEELFDGDLLLDGLLQYYCRVSLGHLRPLVQTDGMDVYLEATSNSGVKVRNLAENSLVDFPLAVFTGNREVRKLAGLKKSRKLLARETDSIASFRTPKSSERT